MKLILSPNFIRESLINYYRGNKKVLLDHKFMSPENYIYEAIDYNPASYIELYNTYNNLKLFELKKSIKDINFLNEVLDNKLIIDYYNIDIDSLNIHNEYKEILGNTNSFDKAKLNKFLANDFSSVLIYKYDYNPIIQDILDKMIEKGAKYLEMPKEENHQEYKLKVINERAAIDNIATYIIENNLDLNDCAIIANASIYNILSIHLNRFNIPTKFTSSFRINNKAQLFIAILELYFNFDIKNYIELINLNLYKTNYSSSLIEYLANHSNSIKLDEFNNFINADKYYKDLEEKANKAHKLYLPLLNKLNKAKDMKEVITYTFEEINDDSKEMRSIKNILEEYKDNLNNDSYIFIKQELNNLRNKDENEGLRIINYRSSLINTKYLFVLDPNIDNYPNFKTKEGFINEEVLSNTDYPNIKSRFNKRLESFNYLNNSLITFYILIESTLDGKSVEYENSFKDKAEYKALEEVNQEISFEYKRKIDKETAKNIYLKDNLLEISVSGLERYLKCPYSYFLNYGLKLKDPQKKELNAALTGTIYHAILEELIKKKSKSYTLDFIDILNSELEKVKTELNKLYPTIQKIIDIVILRIKNSFKLEMEFLDLMEKASTYKPHEIEKNIRVEALKDKMVLRGVVDRIDSGKNNTYRVLDYKTSAHSATYLDFNKGLKLQPFIYAILLKELEEYQDKIPTGAFYVSCSHSPIAYEENKYSLRNGTNKTYYGADTIKKEFINNHRLSGLVFEVDEMEYDPKLEMDNPNNNYNYVISGSGKSFDKNHSLDFKAAKAAINEIFKYLYEHIISGDISLEPKEGACTYCNYKRICHFKGLYNMRDENLNDIDVRKASND